MFGFIRMKENDFIIHIWQLNIINWNTLNGQYGTGWSCVIIPNGNSFEGVYKVRIY